MKKPALLLGFILILSTFACNKEKADANAHTQIRIVNNTALTLIDVTVSNENYGTLAPFQTTVYHNFDNVSAYVPPMLRFYNDKVEVENFIGYCGTPPLPQPSYLQGTFTYTIIADDTSPQGFRFTFTKD